MIGDNPASKIYVRNKIKACEEVGFKSISVNLEHDLKAIMPMLVMLFGNSTCDNSVHISNKLLLILVTPLGMTASVIEQP